MEIKVEVSTPRKKLYPVNICLEPDEARLLCEFLGKTNRIMEAELLGESAYTNKIQDLDKLLFDLYENLHAEGY